MREEFLTRRDRTGSVSRSALVLKLPEIRAANSHIDNSGDKGLTLRSTPQTTNPHGSEWMALPLRRAVWGTV